VTPDAAALIVGKLFAALLMVSLEKSSLVMVQMAGVGA
jgi:hypothetical protein